MAALALLAALVPLTGAAAQETGRTVVDLDLTADDVSDPVETSILLSQQTFQSADEVIVATSADGADALASGSLQSGVGGAAATTVDGEAVEGRPLFFVDPAAGPEQALMDEVERLGATRVILLGGIDALSQGIADELGGDDVEVTRIGGSSRIETAVLIAEFVTSASEVDVAYLSRAFGTDSDTDTAFADASALGGWAASSGVPILLTETDQLSDATAAFLEGSDIATVDIIGGTVAVGQAVQDEVDADFEVERIAGPTRDETATEIAAARELASPASVVLVEGFEEDFFIDSFSAAAYSGLNDAPILLTDGDSTSPATEDFLTAAEPSLTEDGTAVLCTPVVAASVCEGVATDVGGEVTTVTLGGSGEEGEPVGDLPVSPFAEQEVPFGLVDDDTDEVTYTITGLDDDERYRVSLVLDENITIDGGTATFVSGDTEGVADPGASEDVAVITEVNGEPVDTPAATVPGADSDPAAPEEIVPVDGQITVTVDALNALSDATLATGGTVYPVAYVNGGESTFLEIDESGAPTELYGVGGAFIAMPE